MGKKKVMVILGAVAVAASAAAGIWYFLGNNRHDSNDRVYVERVASVMGNITGAQNRYSGVVQPQETVEVNADPERTVKDVLVETGDMVEVGTPLFNYDTEDLNLELEQAKLELENQDIEINNYKSQIVELEKERTAAAEANKFEYTTQIQTIQTQIKKAEFEKSSKQLEMDKIRKKVENSQVLSKASGIVKSINNGQSSEQEAASAFMTILSTGEYRIKGTANEQNINMIASGSEVIIRSRVDETVTWRGIIDSLDTEEPESSSDDNMMYSEGEDSSLTSSDYSFFVSMEDAEGLMLGQHVLIELDEGQTEQKEGIWLYSGYIVFEDADVEGMEGLENDSEWLEYGTEWPDEGQDDWQTPDLSEDGMEGAALSEDGMDGADVSEDGIQALDALEGDLQAHDGIDRSEVMSYALDDAYGEYGTEEPYEMYGTQMPQEGDVQSAYVWADDGNGRLEKRAVEVGMYDMEQDKYEILSGLTEEDLIAWPMEGLYEGVKTVLDMEEVDYSSGLYNQGGDTEEIWNDPAFDGMGGDGLYEENYDDGMSVDDGYDDGMSVDDGYDDGSYEEEPSGDANAESDTENRKDAIGEKKEPLDLDDFLHAEGIR